MTKRKRTLLALLVAPLAGVALAYASLFAIHGLGFGELILVLALLVLVPAIIARRLRNWPTAIGASIIALAEAFALLLFLLSRANLN